MKKKKTRRKKSSLKKTQVVLATGIPKEKKAGLETGSQRVELQTTPTKKDISRKAEAGVFAPKKYFLIARHFLAEARVELKKVTWPTRKELLSTTAVVILLVLLVAFFLGIVDLGLVKIIKNVIG
jgi:preprotein translocase subunit SecE